MSGWCKNIMSTEQKKSDFRPEEHGVGLVERTTVVIRDLKQRRRRRRRKRNIKITFALSE